MDDKLTTLIDRRFQEMLSLQDSMNSLINPDWRSAKNPWYRAIWTECAELIEHIGWKWWRKQTPDTRQIELELVDIFHFGLSYILEQKLEISSSEEIKAIYQRYGDNSIVRGVKPEEAIGLVESFALDILQTQKFDLQKFCTMSKNLGLEEVYLYEKYVGKNVLNRFRQDNGYKSGTYIKIWHGREDNEWLSELASASEKNPATFADDLYRNLSDIYIEVKNGQ